MNKPTLTRMQLMKLFGMHTALKSVVEDNGAPGLSADQLVGHLVNAEYGDKYNRKILRPRKTARLRYQAAIEEIRYEEGRNLDREMIIRLADDIYLDKAENLFITGRTGVGKSYLACAFGHQACSTERRVIYFNTARLLSQLKMSKADGTYVKAMRQIQRQHLIIVDDFGLQPIDMAKSHILLEVVEDRYTLDSLSSPHRCPWTTGRT